MNSKAREVPGWGADLDWRSRPGGVKEADRRAVTEIRVQDEYDLIPRQEPGVEVLISTEHKKLTPVFGTACPPKGLSGVLRRLAFRFSEGQKAHWLILILADRVDVFESGLTDLVRGRAPHPFREMGLRTEFRRSGFPTRFGRGRADTRRWRQQALLAVGVIGAIGLVRRSR